MLHSLHFHVKMISRKKEEIVIYSVWISISISHLLQNQISKPIEHSYLGQLGSKMEK